MTEHPRSEPFPHRGGSGPCALVVHNQVIVAEDIADALRNLLPGCQVTTARNMQQAVRDLDEGEAPSLAFIESDPVTLSQSELGRRLAAAGARVVLLGEAAEQSKACNGYAVLERPFTFEMLDELLRSLAGGQTQTTGGAAG